MLYFPCNKLKALKDKNKTYYLPIIDVFVLLILDTYTHIVLFTCGCIHISEYVAMYSHMCSGQRVIVEDKIVDQVVQNVVTIQVKRSLMDFLYKNSSHCALILITYISRV